MKKVQIRRKENHRLLLSGEDVFIIPQPEKKTVNSIANLAFSLIYNLFSTENQLYFFVIENMIVFRL